MSSRLPNAVLASAIAAVIVLLPALFLTSARAQPTLEEVANALTQSPVYNDPDAVQSMSDQEVAQLTQDIKDTTLPYYIAVLPGSVLTDEYPTERDYLMALNQEMGLAGVYGVVIEKQFRAGATSSYPSVAAIASASLQEYKSQGTYAVLQAFVAASSERIGGEVPTSWAESHDPGFPWLGVGLLGAAAAGGGYLIYRGNKKSKLRRARELDDVKKVIDEDVTEYGERLAQFEMRDPRLDEAAQADLQTALDSYERAKAEVDKMATAGDAAKVTTHLEDGRYALACVSARLAGEPLPERRPPCFIDPRHGPSTEDIMYTPVGAAGARETPVCPLCANTIKQGGNPAPREVPVQGGARVPYWQAGQQYAPYANGYYSSFGDVLPAILIGTMMGSMFSHGSAYGAGYDQSGGGGFGGGDFGGGDFGGGGGGFSGGDFGGGDFGGGSF